MAQVYVLICRTESMINGHRIPHEQFCGVFPTKKELDVYINSLYIGENPRIHALNKGYYKFSTLTMTLGKGCF